MTNFQSMFQENKSNIVEYNGQNIYRYIPIRITKRGVFRFRFIGGKSKFDQAIVLAFADDFNGNIYLDGKQLQIKKTAFPKVNFWKSTSPVEFVVEITNFDGMIMLCNGSDPLGTKQFCRYQSSGCAMKIEKNSKTHWRCLCNDHEYDDDFDDLIFEVELA